MSLCHEYLTVTIYTDADVWQPYWTVQSFLSFTALKSLPFSQSVIVREGEKKSELGETMVAGMVVNNGGEYNGKMTSFVLLSCMIAATGGVIFGYDIGISGLSLSQMERFSMKKNFAHSHSSS